MVTDPQGKTQRRAERRDLPGLTPGGSRRLARLFLSCAQQRYVFPFARCDMAITKAEVGKTRIGWIGTGVMGRWMCQHLLTKGFKATVYNRGRDKAAPLLDAGA